MKAAFHRLMSSWAPAYALAIAAVIASCATVASLLPPAGWAYEAGRIALVLVAAVGVLALGAHLTASLRTALPASGRRQCLSAWQAARGLGLRSLLAAACALGLAATCGIAALVFQHTLGALWGIGAAMAAARILSSVAVLASAPLPVLLLIGYVRSRSAAWRPWQEVCSAKGAYLPVLLSSTFALLLGWGAHALCALVPLPMAGHALFVLASVVLGAAWICACCALCLLPGAAPARHAQPTERIRRPQLPAAVRRRAWQGTACLMAVLLAAGLVSPDAIAFAVEGEGPAVMAAAPEPIDPSEAEPPDPAAKAPEGYYDPELPEGRLVYAEDSMAVYQTGPGAYSTVIGGADAAYVDESGTARPIDNTLEGWKRGLFSDEVDYTNRANAFEATLPDEVTETRPIRLQKDGHALELTPSGGDFSRSAAAGGAIRYTEVRAGIDYQYTLVGSMVKEDIVLTRAVEPQELSTRIKLSEGLTATLENGIVMVRDATGRTSAQEDGADRGIFGDVGAEDADAQSEGPASAAEDADAQGEGPAGDESDVVFAIAAPTIIDAAGEATDSLGLTLDQEADGTLTLGLNPDWDWICAPERAYPVRIDPTVNIAPSAVRVSCVEQTSPNSIIGENNYSYAGFDDGIKTGTGAYKPGGHYICRVYAAIDYNFGYIMSEAKINSAYFSLYQHRAYSGGASNFGLYRITNWWDFNALTWNNQTGLGHEFVQYQRARTSPGYISWDVREVVNNWVQGVYTQRGFCVKAENERWMQCEMFQSRNMANPPRLTINWEIPDPVDESYGLNDTTVNLRTVTEHDANNKLALDGVFADGMARPRAWLAYELDGKEDETGLAYASRSYKYPDSSSWDEHVPGGTRYKDKLSNWQTHLFTGLEYDKEYKVKATPTLDGSTGAAAESDRFLVYKASAKDTLPYIASHYGTTLDTLSADNRVQDTLVVGGNTLFVRNPSTTEAYAPKDLTTDQKKRIDSALMGRGKHCEYGFEPINLNTGNFVMELTDAALPDAEGSFALARTYNSKNDAMDSPFGRNWSFAYAESLGMAEDGTVVYSAGDGKTLLFEPDGQGGYVSPVGFDLELVRIPYKASDLEGGEDADGEGAGGEEAAPGEGEGGDAGDEGPEAAAAVEGASDEADDADDADEGDGEEEEPTLYRWELRSSDGSCRSFDAWGMLTEVRSAKGLATTIGYDEAGRLASITSPLGTVYHLTLDSQGHITQVALPDGNKLSYAYDSRGNLVSYTDAAGGTITYVYDEQSRMTEWRDANGTPVVRNVYDGEGRVTCQTDAAGNASTLTYAEGSTTTMDAAGNVTVYRYDDQLRTTSITYPDGHEVSRSYDAENNLVADEDGTYAYDGHGRMTQATVDGNATAYAYDERGRLLRQAEPDGTVTEFGYDTMGNLAWTASNAGDATSFNYDAMGRCLSMTDADGVTASFTWEGGCVTAVTDGAGNTTRLAYDAMGRCVSVTDALGHTSRTMYDAAGRVVGEQDATGAYTAYSLDAVGLLSSVTDPRGYATRFAYDAVHNIASMTDAAGNVTQWSYDALGNLTAEVGPTGAREERSYDSRGRLASVTDGEGGTTAYAYDGRGRMTSVTNPLGGTETYAYEGTSEVPSVVTDPLGNVTRYRHDARGNVTGATYADGAEESVGYGLGGRLESATSALGLATTYSYTAAGRLAAVDEGGRTTRLSYDAAGNMASVTDALGRTTGLYYDAAGNVAAATAPNGATTTYAYDTAGRQVSATDALGNTTQWAYDSLGNVASVIDAVGAVTAYGYDELGRAVSVTDALGGVQSVLYDAAGDVVASTDQNGAARAYAYDAAHRITQVTDALGRITSYSYDAAGNVVEVGLPDGTAESYAYDAAGNPVRTEDARGYAVELAYDARGRLSRASDSLGAAERYSYDAGGNLTEVVDAIGGASRFEYDRFGNVVRQVDASGAAAAYAYDAAYQLVRETDALGAVTSYAYDALGNLTRRTTGGASESWSYDAVGNMVAHADGNGAKATYAYDAAGRLTEAADALGRSAKVAYDALGRATQATDARGNTRLYAYDAAGNLTGSTDRAGAATTYEFDAEGQLTAVSDALGNRTSYSYDEAGNLAQTTDALGRATGYTYDAGGALTSIESPSGAVEEFARDAAGRLTAYRDASGAAIAYGYDAAGNLTSKSYNQEGASPVTYALDAMGRVTARTDSTGEASVEYDALGRIAAETDGLGQRLAYAYDARGNLASLTYPNGEQVSYSYDGAGNLASVAAPEGEYRYSYDAAGQPATLSRPNGTSTSYGYDGDGNVSSVETRGPSGSVLSRYAYSYDAEGRIAAEEASVADASGALHATTRSFSYDGAGRLATSDVSGADGAYSEAYTYDAAGNRARLERTGEGADDIRYAYDADDRLVREESAAHGTTTYTYDAAGQLVSKRADGEGETTYDYGVEGRLEAVRQGGRALMAAAYDGDGHRVMQATPFHYPVEGTDGSGIAGNADGPDGEGEG